MAAPTRFPSVGREYRRQTSDLLANTSLAPPNIAQSSRMPPTGAVAEHQRLVAAHTELQAIIRRSERKHADKERQRHFLGLAGEIDEQIRQIEADEEDLVRDFHNERLVFSTQQPEQYAMYKKHRRNAAIVATCKAREFDIITWYNQVPIYEDRATNVKTAAKALRDHYHRVCSLKSQYYTYAQNGGLNEPKLEPEDQYTADRSGKAPYGYEKAGKLNEGYQSFESFSTDLEGAEKLNFAIASFNVRKVRLTFAEAARRYPNEPWEKTIDLCFTKFVHNMQRALRKGIEGVDDRDVQALLDQAQKDSRVYVERHLSYEAGETMLAVLKKDKTMMQAAQNDEKSEEWYTEES